MRTLNEIVSKLPAARRNKINARTAELLIEEMTLQDLRKARELTQERMAELLDIGQDSVSRLEKRSDLLLSTLRSYVAAMGGTLDLVVRFADRSPVVISSLEDIASPPPKKAAKGARPVAVK